jgi:hypothetical protein
VRDTHRRKKESDCRANNPSQNQNVNGNQENGCIVTRKAATTKSTQKDDIA